MGKRRGTGSRWLLLALSVAIVIGAILPASGLAYAQERAASYSGKEVMYFGIVQQSGIDSYAISTVPIEMTFRGGTASQEQTNAIVHAVVGDRTEVVTLDGTRVIEPGTPVVVAGYENGGIVEARVIGDLHTAKPSEESVPIEEDDADAQAAELQSVSAMAAVPNTYSELPSETKPHEITRYTTISGGYEKMLKGRKESPMWTIGPLKISFYAEFFTGADIQWDWPFEIVAKLHNPLRYVDFFESQYQKGETWQQRNDRMRDAKALMTVDFVPQDPKTKRSFYGEVGLRLTVGLKGSIFGEQFDVPIDINKLASLAGGLGTHLSVGGKKAPPLWGQTEAIGIKDTIGINEDIVECTIGCTIDFFSEDVVGVKLPFFEAGIFSMGFAFQPFVVVYGDMPKLVNIKATNGLVAEKISDYSILGFHNNPNSFVPVSPDTIINPYDALALIVQDQYVDGNNVTAPALREGAELSFETRYEPEATVGYMIQTSIKISKLGLSATLNAPMAFVPLPFKFKLSGGKGLISLDDYDKQNTSSDYTKAGSEAIYFSPERIAGSMRLTGEDSNDINELTMAVSGAQYESQPFRIQGGLGTAKLKTVGLVPGGLKLTAKGDGYYVLAGTPLAKEGRYSIKVQGTDSSGYSKNMTLQLPVAKVYPEKLDIQLTEGQSWSQSFKLVAPDGTAYDSSNLSWSIEGGQPGMSFMGDILRMDSVLPGNYTFEVQVRLGDSAESYLIKSPRHQATVHATGLSSAYEWRTARLAYSEDVSTVVGSTYGAAAWDPSRGKIAIVMEGSGNYGLVLDGEKVERANPRNLPIILNGTLASMSYAAPSGKDGWMYIFDQHLYRWNRDGTGGLLHLNAYGAGPEVEDAMTTALPDGRLLLFGGRFSGSPKFPVDGTWIYDPNMNAMSEQVTVIHPSARFGSAAMVYVPEMDKAVLIGGDYSTGADGAIDSRQTPDGGIWLFDPQSLQWSEGLPSHRISMNEGDASQLVYARNEQKLYALITGDSPARLYSISIANDGQMGPLINETNRLPGESAMWQPRVGLLAYDELQAALTYIQDDKVSSYQLPEVNADRRSIAADGTDTIRMDFNLNAYLNGSSDLDDWMVEWRPVGNFKPWDTVVTSPDANGFISLELTHLDMLMTERKTAHWMLYAKNGGLEQSIAKATFEVVPTPPDMENSSIVISPDHLSDLNGLSWDAGITDIAELTITLQSAGTTNEDNGLPLQERELILLNALELEEQGIRVSKGDRNNIDDYVFNDKYFGTTVLKTDAAGQIHLTWLNDRAAIGEYTLQFELQDGSGMVVAAVVAIEPFVPIPSNTEYWFEGKTNGSLNPSGKSGASRITFTNLKEWYYSGNDPYSYFEIVSGKLPEGVELNEKTGELKGSPTEAGVFEADVRLPNQERTVRLRLTVTDTLTLAYEDRIWEHPAVVGESYYQSVDVRVEGGVRPFAYEVTEGELPPGLTLDPETGIVSGVFTQSWNGYVTIQLTDSSKPSSDRVSKRYFFQVEEQKELGTSYSVFDELLIDSHARLWASKYAGIPIGSPEGVFSPWKGGMYFELKRPDTTSAIPFTMSITGEGIETLRLFYWNADMQQWTAFKKQTSELSDDWEETTLTVHVEDADEISELWEAGDGLFIERNYNRLRLAVGSEAPAKPLVTGIRKVPSGLNVVEEYFIKGANFTPDAKVYFGAREGLNTYLLDSETLVTVVPPGEGSKHVYVINYAGVSDAADAAVYTYPEEMKIPKEDIRLKLSMLTNSNWPEDRPPNLLLLDNEILVEVQMVDSTGKTVRPEEVDMSEADRRITITNWGDPYRMEVVSYPGDLEGDSPYVPSASRLVGRINDDGFYRAVLRLREASDPGGCEEVGEGCGEPGEPEEPGEGESETEPIEQFEVDISVETPGGLYNRGSIDAAPEQIREYEQVETLRIATDSLPAGNISEPYHAKLEGAGGRSGGYRWYWGAGGDIPPGIVLDPISGVLRDLSGDEKREGEYHPEIVLSDGVVSTRSIYTIRITNEEENPEPGNGGGDDGDGDNDGGGDDDGGGDSDGDGDNSISGPATELSKELAGKIRVRVDRFKAVNATDISIVQSELSVNAPADRIISPVFQVKLLPEGKVSTEVPGIVEIYYDPSSIPDGYEPKIVVFNEATNRWMELKGIASQGVIRAESRIHGQFVILAVKSIPTFSDISGHWSEQWIEQGVLWNLTKGYPDATFRPDAPISRMEFVAMLMRTLGIEDDMPGVDAGWGYADEQEIPEWGRSAASAAASAGIVNGYDDGSFRPSAPITRTEMIAMMARVYKLQQPDTDILLGYHDYADIPEWSAESFAAALQYGLIEGGGDNRLLPLSVASRAEIITMLVRAKQLEMTEAAN